MGFVGAVHAQPGLDGTSRGVAGMRSWAGLGWPHPTAKTRAAPGDHPGVPLESIRPVLVVHVCASFLIYGVCMHIESGHVSQFSVFVVKFRYNGSCEFLRCWWCEMGFALLQAEIKSPMH